MALNAKTIAAGVGDILNVDSGLTGSLKQVLDGDGTGSPISLSTSLVSISGSVGIGLTGPAKPLHIKEDNSNIEHVGVLVEQDGTGDAKLGFLLTGGQEFSIGIDNSISGDSFVIADGADLNTNPRFTINSSGNIGIGISEPGYKLEITEGSSNEIARFGGANSGTVTFRNAASNEFSIYSGSSDKLMFGTNNTYDKLVIDTAGNVGIGTNDPKALLHIERDLNAADDLGDWDLSLIHI